MINKTENEIIKNWKGVKEEPVVSIKCLTYNHRDYIESALDGFLMQETTFPFEIVIHDDASTDGTAEIIRLYEEKYPTILRPIYEVENQYSKRDGSLRKIVNSKLRGKYIAHCEGDDYWIVPFKLQKQYDYMMTHPECTMVYHAVNYEENGEIVCNDRSTDKECDMNTEKIIEGGGMYCATPSLFYKKNDYMEYPNFRIMADVGDYPLQLLLASKGTVHYYPDIMGVYRKASQGSWTTGMKDNKRAISHWCNEMQWLSEFDSYTEFRYHNSVLVRLFWCYCCLQDLDADNLVNINGFKDLKEYISLEERKVLELKKDIYNNDVVVFGNGYIGKSLCDWIIQNHICSIKCICDNKVVSDTDNTGWKGYKIYSPAEAFRLFPKSFFIIANSSNSEVMKKQLEIFGVSNDCIRVKKNTFFEYSQSENQ